jgi:hypothetical protein
MNLTGNCLCNKKIKYLFLFLLNICILNIVFSQESPGLAFGGNDTEYGYSICLTSDGGYAMVGSTRSMGGGNDDFYFIKLDSTGEVTQEKTYTGSNQNFLRKIKPFQNGFVIIGDGYDYWPYLHDVFFLRTNEFGNQISSNYFKQNNRDIGFDILNVDDDNFLILGHSRTANPRGDISLAKINYDGSELWKKFYWEDYNIYAFQITRSTDNEGYIMIGSKYGFFNDLHAEFQTHDADYLLIKVDDEGEEIWRKTYGENQHDFGYSICPANDGGYYLFGASQSYGSGSFDMLLIKVNSEGEEQWHKSYGGTSFEYGKSIAKTQSGELYLLGSSKSFGIDGSVDIYIVKTDSEGNELWSETIGGTMNDFGESLVVTPDSGCAIVGSTESFGSGGKDMYFLKLLSDGTVEVMKGYTPVTNSNTIKVSPNPMVSSSKFNIYNTSVSKVDFILYDLNGKVVGKKSFSGNTFIVERNSLKSGTYIFNIVSNGNSKLIFTGKLIIK